MSLNLLKEAESTAPPLAPGLAPSLEREIAAPGVVPGLPQSVQPARLPLPEAVNPRRILWPYALTVGFYHLVALLAFVPWFFSWTGVVLAVLGAYMFGALGINLCYHRLLTHRGFVCAKWLEHTLAILGVCCMEDSPARWVAVHRRHHQHADERPDPHSPLVNFFWGHVGWMLVENEDLARLNIIERYAKDILRDPFYKFVERNYAWIILASWAVFYFGGVGAALLLGSSAMEAVQFGLSVLIWGVFVRTVVVWHITWSVNSVAHLWGYRNYDTDEDSRNNWSSPSSPAARAGTTTTMPIRGRPSTAIAGGRSTSPISRSSCSPSSAWRRRGEAQSAHRGRARPPGDPRDQGGPRPLTPGLGAQAAREHEAASIELVPPLRYRGHHLRGIRGHGRCAACHG